MGGFAEGNLTVVLQAKDFAIGASGGHQNLPGPTRKRAIAHQRESNLDASGGLMLAENRHREDSFIQGGSAAGRCGTRNDSVFAMIVCWAWL